MKDSTPKPVLLKEYRKPDYLVDNISLSFDLHSNETKVHSKMEVRRNPDADNQNENPPFFLVSG